MTRPAASIESSADCSKPRQCTHCSSPAPGNAQAFSHFCAKVSAEAGWRFTSDRSIKKGSAGVAIQAPPDSAAGLHPFHFWCKGETAPDGAIPATREPSREDRVTGPGWRVGCVDIVVSGYAIWRNGLALEQERIRAGELARDLQSTLIGQFQTMAITAKQAAGLAVYSAVTTGRREHPSPARHPVFRGAVPGVEKPRLRSR